MKRYVSGSNTHPSIKTDGDITRTLGQGGALQAQTAEPDNDEEDSPATDVVAGHTARHKEIAGMKKARALLVPKGSPKRFELLYAARMHLSVVDSGRLNKDGLVRVSDRYV